jgi:hypothetical protein
MLAAKQGVRKIGGYSSPKAPLCTIPDTKGVDGAASSCQERSLSVLQIAACGRCRLEREKQEIEGYTVCPVIPYVVILNNILPYGNPLP